VDNVTGTNKNKYKYKYFYTTKMINLLVQLYHSLLFLDKVFWEFDCAICLKCVTYFASHVLHDSREHFERLKSLWNKVCKNWQNSFTWEEPNCKLGFICETEKIMINWYCHNLISDK